MLDYVEIRNTNLELIGIVDTATSVLWSPTYYGAGYVEIYAPASAPNVEMLKEGNYITRNDDPNVGIIERVQVVFNEIDGRMILAAGRFAKSILDRRLIYQLSGTSVSPTIMKGNAEEAARMLVTKNAINCPFDSARNIDVLELGEHSGSTEVIVDDSGDDAEKQATYKVLLDYTDRLLEEYGLGAYMKLSADLKLQYTVFKGVDRSVDNKDGNEPIVFSQGFDNLLSSDYLYSTELLKNTALIGGEGEGLERFCVVLKSAEKGLARREVFVDASSSTRKYNDENDVEQTLTDSQYRTQLITLGKQGLAAYQHTETFTGAIDITQSTVQYGYGKGIYLGDIATIQDNEIGLYINARLLTVTEVKDSSGYNVQIEFGV